MNRIEFSVAGEPVGQPRARHGAQMTRRGVIVRTYTPDAIKGKDGIRRPHPIVEWRRRIKDAASRSRPPTPLEGPVKVTIEVFFERPQRLLKRRSPEGAIRHTAKPDRDNVEKAILDVLQEVGFYRNDSQVCAGGVEKWYVAKGHDPGVIIVVEPLAETEDGHLGVSCQGSTRTA